MNEYFENINCDYCGSNEFTLLAKQTDVIHKTTTEYFSVVRCKRCNLCFTNPRPTEKSIGNYYKSNYSFHREETKLKQILRKLIISLIKIKIFCNLSFLFPKKINQSLINYVLPDIDDPVLKYVSKFSGKIIRFIDIGCGSGHNAHFWGYKSSLKALSKKIKVYGVEPSKKGREDLKNNNIEVSESIRNIKSNKKFEIIRLNWSLEHVHYPSSYFKFIKNHLTKDGIAIICVPNINGMIFKINKNCLELPIHLFHFDKSSISRYAEKFGLEMTLFTTFSYPAMYAFAERIGLISTELNFDTMTLSNAKNFLKLHYELDKVGLGNDLVTVLRLKS